MHTILCLEGIGYGNAFLFKSGKFNTNLVVKVELFVIIKTVKR